MNYQEEHDGTVDYFGPTQRAAFVHQDDENLQEGDNSYGQELATLPAEGTLLPAPIASAISLATRSTSFILRLGTFVGGCGLGVAKVTTLTSLEIGRGLLEGILSRAGKDVVARSTTELGRADAETMIERSLESLHQTMTQIVFWTTTSFHLTGTTVSAVSRISQILLSVLDQFFGSTDSSRAIASIITLIRREFQNPATGIHGEQVGVMDLVLGVCGLAYLQVWCRKLIQEDARRLCQEEIVWDVVVLDDNQGLGTHESSLYGVHQGNYTRAGESGVFHAIEQHGSYPDSSEDDEIPETYLKQQIIASLPDHADVSISTSTTITKTITVEVKGAPLNPLLAPPGLHVVESEVSNNNGDVSWSDAEGPTYKVVYRVSRNKVRSTAQEEKRDSRVEVLDDEESAPLEHDDNAAEAEPQTSPPVPPKDDVFSVRGPTNGSRQDQSQGQLRTGAPPRSQGSYIPMPKETAAEQTANQKRTRKPLGETRPIVSQDAPAGVSSRPNPKITQSKKAKEPDSKTADKKGGFRGVLRKGSVPAFSNLLNKDSSSDHLSQSSSTPNKQKTQATKPPWGSHKPAHNKTPTSAARGPIPNRDSSLVHTRETPRAPQRGNPNFFSSRDLGGFDDSPGHQRSGSRSSYVSIPGNRRNSVVSQTDTFSVHSFDSRAPSPSFLRAEIRTQGLKPSHAFDAGSGHHSPMRGHHRGRSHVDSLYSPSIYTLKTTGSQTSIVLSNYNQKSAYGDSKAVDTLRRTGMVEGMFPNFHILRNITRYSRYASAAYGSQFLRFMGIAKNVPVLKALDDTHQDVRYFAHHVELPASSILLSSFVDPQGGSDLTGSTDTGVPLVHTIAVDEASKAVVLSCRGTLGFEDVLADMMCEYDDLHWRGRSYKVHKGIHASARRLLYGGDGRVLLTLREALEEFPDYGLVLCGHSLGGAVTAILGMMLAEPAAVGTAFVTSAHQHQHRRLLTGGSNQSGQLGPSSAPAPICLPSGRPIHVYTYGPPATVSPALQRATRGLITSTVHGNDLVPYLSLGVLHDLQALALAFKTDNSDAKAEVRRRIWASMQSGLAEKWYNNPTAAGPTAMGNDDGDEEMKWAYAALKTLRASMMSAKLLPPGEVFCIESTPALRRDAFVARHNEDNNQVNGEQKQSTSTPGADSGDARRATRVVLRYVRDVETRFREVRFGASMLLDHSPGRYEDALRKLTGGVCDY